MPKAGKGGGADEAVLILNEVPVRVEIEPPDLLADVLRTGWGLTERRRICGRRMRACTVILTEKLSIPSGAGKRVEGRRVVTIEG